MRQSGLRVLVLGDARSFHMERYVYELRRQGCRVLFASLERGSMHHYLLKRRGMIRSLHYLLAAAEVRVLVNRFQPDIINPHYASGYGFTIALARKRRYPAVLLTLLGSDVLVVPEISSLHRRKTAYALSRANFVTADSAFLLERAGQIASLAAGEVIPWGVEEQYLQYHRADYTLGRPLRIIVPRAHEKVYNNLFIVRALAPLINEGAVEVTFPEFGSLTKHFRHNAATLVDDRLKFYSKMSREDFLRFMSMHDVYLSSALSDSSPVSLIEAMGLGLIPITADIPGVREWLNPGSGYLYELYNGNQLRETVARLVQSGDTHETMRRANHVRVVSEAVFEKNIGRVIEIMTELAGKPDDE